MPMNAKITDSHLGRRAVVYVRQSTPGQVVEHTESKRRQYELAGVARSMGFTEVMTIDEDLGRSGSGLVERPGFQRLVGLVCSGDVGAVFCIEASRLARNGRDWHHLIDLCALVGVLVVDPDGVHDPRIGSDRLLLGLKGSMSEYELSIFRQRSLAARDSKAKRGELRFGLPPGFCWNELGQLEMDPDERVTQAIRLIFTKFRELGSVRQVQLWALDNEMKLPIVQQRVRGWPVAWRTPAYHNVLSFLQHPIYAGAYVFGRKATITKVVEGRARKISGQKKPLDKWSVLIRGHHDGYISWDEFMKNLSMLSENAYMQKRADRKSARGGRALLTGLVRCARCARMVRVFYGTRAGNSHRYICRGAELNGAKQICLGVGGIRVDREVTRQLLLAVAPHAVEAAASAYEVATSQGRERLDALRKELEDAAYNARLAQRRHEAVDPDKRLVARELERRWENTLQRVRELESKVETIEFEIAAAPPVERERLVSLAKDLPRVWNASAEDMRAKQRLVRALIQEVIVDVDEEKREAVAVIHWTGGRHTEVRVARNRSYYPKNLITNPVRAVRALAPRWGDWHIAVTLNRARCRSADGATWTELRVREIRDRLKLPAYDPTTNPRTTLSADEAARRLSICVGSVMKLIINGTLPASQALAGAPWEIPVEALASETVQEGVQAIQSRRPKTPQQYLDAKTLRLPFA
jgi:DNA invertase Pin-like site-specific DNA recombinase